MAGLLWANHVLKAFLICIYLFSQRYLLPSTLFFKNIHQNLANTLQTQPNKDQLHSFCQIILIAQPSIGKQNCPSRPCRDEGGQVKKVLGSTLSVIIIQIRVSFMDEAQLRELIPPKQQNPLLKRKPLNLGNKFVALSRSEEVESEVLGEGHLTLLLFGAEWCNVSKCFLPQLKHFYEEANLEEKRVEIIYVGLDRVKKDYEAFVRNMPWLGLPFADEKANALKEFYDIRAIPKLLLLDNRGEEVKNNCREDVYSLKEDEAYQKWSQLRTAQEKTYFRQ